jgi:hypothetical protein
MATLVIHAPHTEVVANDKRSFDGTVSTGIGNGYAIWRSIYEQLSPGDHVVVICKVHKRQAAGTLRTLVPREHTGNGVQRFDVVVDRFVPERYTHADTRLNRNGIALVHPSQPIRRRAQQGNAADGASRRG